MNRLVFLFFFFLAAPCSAGIFTLSETIDFTVSGTFTANVNNNGSYQEIDGGGSGDSDDWIFTLVKPSSTEGSLRFADDSIRVGDQNVAVLGGQGGKPTMTLSRKNNTAFSLGTIAFGGSLTDDNSKWAEQIRITDISTGSPGSFVEFTLNSNLTNYQTMAIETAFANVTEVSFQGVSSGTHAEFTVDNIQIGAVYDPPAAVPEPASLIGMALLCFGSIFISLRRQTASVRATAK